jgi:hypothetical protein
MIYALVLSAALASVNQVSAQERLRRPPAAKYEGIPVVVARSQTVPPGAVLIFEMDTPLSSKYSRESDRFKGRLVTHIVDEYGKTIVAPGTAFVEGHVRAVKPASRPRRSGAIAIDFDRLRLKNGRVIRLRGVLTDHRRYDRKRIDVEDPEKENRIKPSNAGRDVAFVGGGAGAGAGIGLIAGSALAGAGIGAAVGATGLLLTKGKEAVVEQGQRFGVALSQRIVLRSPRPVWPFPIDGPGPPDLVDISYARAERGFDGSVRIFITAETPSTGWRIYTDHRVVGDTVEVYLRGATDGMGFDRVSRPAADPIIISDRNRYLRRVMIRARNGIREVMIDETASGRPSGPLVPSGEVYPPSGNLGVRLAREVEQLRSEYAAAIGVWINRDGRTEVLAQRRPSSDERRLLDSLGSLLNSVQAYNTSSTPAARQNNLARIQEDVRLVELYWTRVRLSGDLNQKFRNVFRDARALVGGVPPPGPPPPPPGPIFPPPRGPRPRPQDYPVAPPDISMLPPSTPEGRSTPDASRVIGQIQQVQFDFGATVGVWIERDGSYEIIGPRQPTADERQLLNGLTALLNSVKDLNSSQDPTSRRNAAARTQDATRMVEQYWGKVRLTPDLNQKFRAMLQESRALADAAVR